MPRGTTLRNVRVSDELWGEAKWMAESRGTNVSSVIRDALAVYSMRHGSRKPNRDIPASACPMCEGSGKRV